MSDLTQLEDGTVITIEELNGRIYTAIVKGIDYESHIPKKLKEQAVAQKRYILYNNNIFSILPKDFKPKLDIPDIIDSDFIHISPLYKPEYLIISDLHWKFLVINVIRGKNILLAVYTGGGKTTMAKAVASFLKRPFFKIPLGSSQDPRATLIGNTLFDPVRGTYFAESEFVKAIQTPFAVILLDEITRAHPDAENILLTVLDHQRYLKLDEDKDQKTINVAQGVCFIGTANFGNEFTTTRVLDRATLDRFLTIEMPLLTEDEEYKLLTFKFPDVNKDDLNLLTKITASIRRDYMSEDRLYSNMISTRMCEEIAEALLDDFTIAEALEVTAYPLFDKEGGEDSERLKFVNLIDSLLPPKNPKTFGNVSPNNAFANAMKKKKNKNNP